MDSSENPFSNLDLWCDWSGDPSDTVEVRMSIEVWCTPNTQLTVLDISHPSVAHVVDFALSLKSARPDDIRRLREFHADPYDSPIPSDEAKAPVTPEQETSHASLTPGPPGLQADAHTPSDSGSVVRAGHTPDGSPRGNSLLDALYASLYQDSPAWEGTVDADQSPQNPRKRNAKAASLPDSVTDSERSYGGGKVKNKNRILNKERQSPVSSTASKHSRSRSLIPRPVNVAIQTHTDPARVPLLRDSALLLGVDLDRFENSRSPINKENLNKQSQVEHKDVGERSPREILTPLMSSPTKTGLDTDVGEEGKSLPDGEDVEKLSTVASAGSPCDTALLSDSVDTSFGGISTQGILFVHPPTPPRTINRPRLVLVDRVFQVRCSANVEPASYLATVTFLLHLQPGRPRGWFELVVTGLPSLSANDHGYVYLRTPDGQGMEFRTMHFKRYRLVDSCLMAQFSIPSKLVIPLRPCDARFYGFLRDFKVNQTIRADVTEDKEDPQSCTVTYTAVCSLDLIQRGFWAERCGFYIYVHGGPDGEYTCHLQTPRTSFQTIQLHSGPDSEIGIAQLQVICAPVNLSMFAVAWEVRLSRPKASSWVPRITAMLEGYGLEDELQDKYLDADKDIKEIVRGEVKSRPVILKELRRKSGFCSWFARICGFFVLLLSFCLSVWYWTGCSDAVLHDCLKMDRLSVGSVVSTQWRSWEVLELRSTETPPQETPSQVAELTGAAVPEEKPVLAPISVLEIDLQPQKRILLPPAPLSLRDRVDYFLGWKGPLPGGGGGA
ncbi:uncharacterized protein N7482_007860 [Penicillium canariense]|uniref:Uncharacterized protein n=1 Tax=Penicillium canariense TaxID=189055 RepID=A0A9W9HZU9_9EURO|nr:uncharacterized protein N7482_007860 [Penicillium canariense]KAJ5160856.1 hypothetical protein N7482_007860 [Penicillium canariense]